MQSLIDSLHPRQREIFEHPARVRVGVCGRRFGKTWLGVVACIATASNGGRAWWIAPTYAITRVGWREMLRKTRDIPGVKIIRGEKRVEFPGGGEISVRSAHNPDNLRGEGLDLAVFDEAPFIDADVWPENVQPMLTERRGRVLLIGTPYGRNWYYQEWEKGLKGDPDYQSWQLPTSDNPIIPPDAIEQQRKTTPDLIFRQEYLAEFLAYQGLVYPEFNRKVHTSPTLPANIQYHVCGVDWGYANAGVMLVFGVDGDGCMFLVHEEYERQRRIEEWATVAKQLQERYRPQAWYCDPSEPDFIQTLERAGVRGLYKANTDVLPGIHIVKSRLALQGNGRARLVLSTEAIHTAIEFESYMWLENKDGLRDQPKKANDHTMDALRYACTGIDQPQQLTVKMSRYA